MSEKKEYKAFRELLKKGIGDRTQTDFAEQCGISREHISRMLRERFIFRPSKSTLCKMAANMEGVSLAELYEACGYVDEAAIITKKDSELTETQKRKKMPVWERVMANVKDLEEGFRSYIGFPLGAHFKDLFDHVQTFFTAEKVSFRIRKAEGRPDGTERAVVEASCDIGAFRTMVLSVVYFHIDTNRNAVMDKVSFSGKDVLDASGLSEKEIDGFSGYGISLAEARYAILMDCRTEDSMESRLLEAIFGTNAEAMDTVVSGFGFYIREVPPHFWKFMLEHRDSFCQTEEETALFDTVIAEQGNPEKCLAEYSDPEYVGYGYAAAIARIMRKETGIPFEVYEDRRGEYEDNPMCLICDDSYEIDNDKLESAAYQYAKELGIPYIQQCYFKTKIYKDANSIIKVE